MSLSGVIKTQKVIANVDYSSIKNVPAFATTTVVDDKITAATSNMLTSTDFETSLGGNVEEFANRINIIDDLEEALDKLKIDNTPVLTATSAGEPGEIRYGKVNNEDYIFICTATNVWKRAQLSTW